VEYLESSVAQVEILMKMSLGQIKGGLVATLRTLYQSCNNESERNNFWEHSKMPLNGAVGPGTSHTGVQENTLGRPPPFPRVDPKREEN